MTELAIMVFITIAGTLGLLYLVAIYTRNKYGPVQGEAITAIVALVACVIDTFFIMNFFTEFFVLNYTACYSA